MGQLIGADITGCTVAETVSSAEQGPGKWAGSICIIAEAELSRSVVINLHDKIVG